MPKPIEPCSLWRNLAWLSTGRRRCLGRARAACVAGAVGGRRGGAGQSLGQGGALVMTGTWMVFIFTIQLGIFIIYIYISYNEYIFPFCSTHEAIVQKCVLCFPHFFTPNFRLCSAYPCSEKTNIRVSEFSRFGLKSTKYSSTLVHWSLAVSTPRWLWGTCSTPISWTKHHFVAGLVSRWVNSNNLSTKAFFF